MKLKIFVSANESDFYSIAFRPQLTVKSLHFAVKLLCLFTVFKWCDQKNTKNLKNEENPLI